MTRRLSLVALLAAAGQILLDDAHLNAQTASSGLAVTWNPPEALQVRLGPGGYRRFEFTDGAETITFTAAELMAALKETR